MKTNIAVFFGCRSVEHEVSIISAVQAMHSINRDKYDVTPIYIAKDGTMYSGDALFEIENYKDLDSLFKASHRVNLLSDNGRVYMHRLDAKRFKILCFSDPAIDLFFSLRIDPYTFSCFPLYELLY